MERFQTRKNIPNTSHKGVIEYNDSIKKHFKKFLQEKYIQSI